MAKQSTTTVTNSLKHIFKVQSSVDDQPCAKGKYCSVGKVQETLR